MSALDQIHRFNTRVVKNVTTIASVTYNACVVVAGLIVIFLAWRLPGYYGWSLDGLWRYLPYGIIAAGLYGIWEGAAKIIALTRSPQAPPSTTRDTW